MNLCGNGSMNYKSGSVFDQAISDKRSLKGIKTAQSSAIWCAREPKLPALQN